MEILLAVAAMAVAVVVEVAAAGVALVLPAVLVSAQKLAAAVVAVVVTVAENDVAGFFPAAREGAACHALVGHALPHLIAVTSSVTTILRRMAKVPKVAERNVPSAKNARRIQQ